ncbi:SurA N-terminal domain-containing protein [Methyloceanibacter sp.]|uniref:SurA N-terminal domain-containing protein n=1 Tax=Methyloceanibacter sp. TaxID=1965321 RepID=UPI002D37B141|nr:SurA N-terminal domain-containing protein [Methyloceanibacter sp.]HZP07994.1 SurA N-terminal domain-containing protein [Methyloceanibacter sp.]
MPNEQDNGARKALRSCSRALWLIPLIAALVVLIALPGPDRATAQEVSIKVLVNDDPISDYDIDQRERFLALTTQEQPSPDLKKKATDMLIDERLQMQEARKSGITPDDDDLNRILNDMAQRNNLSVDGLATALGKGGVNIKTLKDRIRAQLAWQGVVRQKFRHDINVGDADVDKALAEAGTNGGQEGGTATSALQLKQVKFELPANADDKTIASRLAAAEALRARFDNCANVNDLAKGVEGASVKTLTDQQPTSLAQPARLLVMSAKVGQMTPPTLVQSAVEVYAVCGKRTVVGDSKLREETERKLMNQEMMIRAERLLRDLRQDAFIEYR